MATLKALSSSVHRQDHCQATSTGTCELRHDTPRFVALPYIHCCFFRRVCSAASCFQWLARHVKHPTHLDVHVDPIMLDEVQLVLQICKG